MQIPEKIQTERLIIRKFIENDRSKFLEFMLDEDSTKFLNFTQEQKSKDGANAILDWVIGAYETDNPIFSVAVALKSSNEYVGSIGFSPYCEEDEYECYYSINKEYVKKGYAKEAMKALFEYARTNGVKKIYAFNHLDNIASEKLALSLGMTFDGIVKREDLPSEAKKFYLKL